MDCVYYSLKDAVSLHFAALALTKENTKGGIAFK